MNLRNKATENQFDEKRIFCELFQMMCVIVAAKTFILFTCVFFRRSSQKCIPRIF